MEGKCVLIYLNIFDLFLIFQYVIQIAENLAGSRVVL